MHNKIIFSFIIIIIIISTELRKACCHILSYYCLLFPLYNNNHYASDQYFEKEFKAVVDITRSYRILALSIRGSINSRNCF